MTLKEILNHKNVNDEVYLSDCAEWLPGLPSDKLKEVQQELTKLQRLLNANL